MRNRPMRLEFRETADRIAIQSVHPGGAHMLAADGSVHFVAETLDIQTLYNLSNRSDGSNITVDW